MLKSVVEDIKGSFRSGNMITRLVIINAAVYIIMALLEAFSPATSGFFPMIRSWVALPGNPMEFLTKPWTIFTHMFVHAGFFHVLWNMIILYWLGRIVGDLIGDQHILPLYIIGGLVGGTAYLLSYQLLPAIGAYAVGASAGVMAIVIAAGLIAPDYVLHLLLIGPVRLKYIVLAMIFFDIIGAAGRNNTGGHIAHMGGMLLGWFYIRQLGQGVEVGQWVNRFFEKVGSIFDGTTRSQPKRKSPLKVKYKAPNTGKRAEKTTSPDLQQQVDRILEKIKAKGYESLTDEEKETLFQASKK